MNNNEKNESGMNLNTDKKVEIIGVKFKENGKTYYFAPEGYTVAAGDRVIVETARGIEYGFVTEGNKFLFENDIVQPLRRVIRKASDSDTEQFKKNRELEKQALEICRKKIEEHGLDMKLIEAEYTFDNSKLMFYFTADSRVDFRELVKDLASLFRTRIELRQIGIRDEAKMLGGIGICGRPFCCSSFLSDFVQVSIKMAKEQNLSLNSAKISGTCGRLMCCLRYEHEAYEKERAITPKIGAKVSTSEGAGVVTDSNLLTGLVKVKFSDGKNETVKVFDRNDVKVLQKKE